MQPISLRAVPNPRNQTRPLPRRTRSNKPVDIGSCLGSELGDTQNWRSFIHIRLALPINGQVRPMQLVSIAVRDFPQQINAHAVAVGAYECAFCVCMRVSVYVCVWLCQT